MSTSSWDGQVDNFGDMFKRRLVPEMYDILLTKALNRSVSGSMTDMIKLSRCMLIEDGKSLEETSAQLNKTPFKAIDYNHPRDQFAKLAQ